MVVIVTIQSHSHLFFFTLLAIIHFHLILILIFQIRNTISLSLLTKLINFLLQWKFSDILILLPNCVKRNQRVASFPNKIHVRFICSQTRLITVKLKQSIKIIYQSCFVSQLQQFSFRVFREKFTVRVIFLPCYYNLKRAFLSLKH